LWVKNLDSRESRHWKKVTQGHTMSRSRAARSLPRSVKGHVGVEPHAKTPPPAVLSPEVTATQAPELLTSVSARTCFRVQTQNF